MIHSILWRGLYFRGHEACRLRQQAGEWHLEGTAVFLSDDRPCRLSYLIACDSSWKTLRASVSGWVGDDDVQMMITVDAHRRWELNGTHVSAVDGCIDLDLNFSPVTNLLPIRRLNLGIGEKADVKAAWLRFPSFELEPLPQVYTRLDEFRYRFASSDGEFVRELSVNEVGFVTDYPGFWTTDEPA